MAKDAIFSPDWVSPPGDTIASILANREVSERDFALQLGRTVDDVQALICGHAPVTPELARELSRVLGSTEGFWTRRETRYRQGLEQLQREASKSESETWLGDVPVMEMIRRGWIQPEVDRSKQIEACLRFFGVASVISWRESYRVPLESASFRTSKSFSSNSGAIAAWFRQGEILASRIVCETWNREHFVAALPEIRKLTRWRNPEAFTPELTKMCADCGVAVIVLRSPEMCKASGACLFLSPERPLILLSGRHLSDDHLWFTFFHEAGHLILHGSKYIFVDDGSSAEEHLVREEEEANRFAENVLVPPEHQKEFLQLRADKRAVMRFAVRVGVSRGIIVGQLQNRGIIGHNVLNGLKQFYKWGTDESLHLSL